MLGAIAGDLAAWTYENDRECFFASLTSKNAVLSELGETALQTALWSIDRKDGDIIELENVQGLYPRVNAKKVIQLATLAWSNDEPENCFEPKSELFSDDKEGLYAGKIIVHLIHALHKGKSKSETISEGFGKTLYEEKQQWNWKDTHSSDGPFTYLMRAWDCFEKAWDFTSAIHNAARWENVDRHLLCSLNGAIAESMYGCEYRLLKAKYGNNWYNFIEYPDAIVQSTTKIKDYQFQTRYFFPKNSALTNVERHIWKPYQSSFEERVFLPDEYREHLRSAYTGWENRYGLYLDDGWVYVYRSASLLARFKYLPYNGRYVISNVQKCEESKDDTDMAIEQALKGKPKYY